MRRMSLFLASLAIWYLLTWPYDFEARTMDWQILFAGVLFSVVAVLLFAGMFAGRPSRPFAPARFFWALCYLPFFFYQMLIANLDVVYRVVHPRMPIRPGIVKVKTSLRSESARVALADSITLTPGTLTVDITEEGFLYVHWINVQATDVEAASRRIVHRFEPLLRKIFD